VAAPQQATPTEIIPEKTAVVEGEKEKAAKKPTFKIVPKETISEETAPKKVTSKETKTFSLSPEEERLLVEEIKKRLYPESLEDVEKLFETILLLDEAGSLSKYNDLLCSMVRKNLNREMPEKGAICCLAKVRSEESIPTLIWAFANTKSSYERDLAKRAIEVIKKGEEIDLKSSLGRGRGFSFPSCSWITIVPKTSSLSGPE